jgi:hypothetical protein
MCDDDAVDPQEYTEEILCRHCWGMLDEGEKCLLCENKRLERWINDLLAGKNINCVYCGFNFGPDEVTAATMHEQLYEHIKQCEKHPLAAALKEIEQLRAENEQLRVEIRYRHLGSE